ncbi:hypothetical protein SLS53_006129 [Cytospora paraplurivora]|uniref:Rhodopsin domain-containing protein n=1 Tax=Cytospora paraplurivora TaxID=2898453 RepID=A0AAN9U3U8_9PEZI
MVMILKRFLIEDWLAVATCVSHAYSGIIKGSTTDMAFYQLLQVAFCSFVLLGVSHGLGAHVENVPVDERPKALLWKWAGQVAYIVVSTMVKFVVGIFLLRLCVNDGWQRITIWVLLVFVGLYNAFYVFIAIFQCQPVPYYWWRYTTDPPVTGQCNGHALATVPTYFAVIIGIAGDLILALLPITLIKKAKLDRKTKISVVCVLSLGSLASVATIARIPYIPQLISNPDYLYNFTDLAIWSVVECGIAITASSLATLRPLFVKLSILASNHFSSQFTSFKGGNAGLPIFNNHHHTTLISSSQRHDAQDNRYTAMPAKSAARSGHGSVASGGGKNEGIKVEKEFEMSIITRGSSQDSSDQVEAEASEVLRPETTKYTISRDQQLYGSLRSSPRSSPSPLQPSYWDAPTIVPSMTTRSAGSSISSVGGAWPLETFQPNSATQSPRSLRSARKAGSLRSQRQSQRSTATTFGGVGFAHPDDVLGSSSQPFRFGHQSTNSDSGLQSQGTRLSPAPTNRLPTNRQHVRDASSASAASKASVPQPSHPSGTGTFGAAIDLPLPVSVNQPTYGSYMSGVNTAFTNPSTTSLGHHSENWPLGDRPITPIRDNHATNTRFPFQNPEVIQETKDEQHSLALSSLLAGNPAASVVHLSDHIGEELTGSQLPHPYQEDASSPMRIHPSRANWL